MSPIRLSHVDVNVVDGGPAGLATAIALRCEGFAVAVFEQTNYRSSRISEHIPPSAKPLLAAIGLSDELASGRHARCPDTRSIWGKDEPEDRHYLFHPHGEGVNLSRPDFDLSFAELAEGNGAVVATNARVTNLTRGSSAWCISVAQSGTISKTRADVVIDATGRAASVAKWLGMAHLR